VRGSAVIACEHSFAACDHGFVTYVFQTKKLHIGFSMLAIERNFIHPVRAKGLYCFTNTIF